MLLSMTGFGEAREQTGPLTVGVEVRAVNNRYLKVTVRGTDPYPMFEPELEKVVRRHVRRGTLLIHVRVERQARSSDLRLNADALRAYFAQVRAAFPAPPTQTATDAQSEPDAPSDPLERYGAVIAALIDLPGVSPEQAQIGAPPDDEWPVVEKVLEAALRRLDGMRREEGRTMANELLLHQRHIRDQLELVRQHLPAVMADYRVRLLDRVRQAVAEGGGTVEPQHLIREVALFADRSDVSEEITRLASHLDQFEEIIRRGGDSPGRKLEFVVQEMGRETNTLGSKAGDVTVSRHAVEIKATLEKIRELVQNVE